MENFKEPALPTAYGVPLKYISLCTLCTDSGLLADRNSLIGQIMHYSRIMHVDNGRYFTSTAVFLSEVSKFGFCVIVVVVAFIKGKSKEGNPWSWKNLWSEMFGGDAWKLSVPAALYTLQNNLEYIALSNIDATTFQLCYQGKILATALFSVILLHRFLSFKKWVSLFLITLGVALVQLPPDFSMVLGNESFFSKFFQLGTVPHIPDQSHSDVRTQMDRNVGLVSVFAACTLSGLAGVYFEMVLKRSDKTIYVRNLQLSFFSLFPAFFLGVLWKDGREIGEKGFLYGYNSVVWTAIGFQASGGIIVGLCVAYADTILKNFASLLSVLISGVASVYFFDFVITSHFLLGSGLVLFAICLYSTPERHAAASTRSRSAAALEEGFSEKEEMKMKDTAKD